MDSLHSHTVETPEPWMLSSYFSGKIHLDDIQKAHVEEYLEACPQIRAAYEDMNNRDTQRAKRIREFLQASTSNQ